MAQFFLGTVPEFIQMLLDLLAVEGVWGTRVAFESSSPAYCLEPLSPFSLFSKDILARIRPSWRDMGLLQHSAAGYHSSFSPNWICRELVEVDVINPAVGEYPPVAAAYTTGFGVLKLV